MNKATSRALSGLLSTSALIAAGQFPVFMAPPTPAEEAIAALEEERAELHAAAQAILDAADEASEDPSDEDQATIDGNITKIQALDKKIAARKALLAATPVGTGRKSAPEPQNRGGDGDGNPRRVPAQPRVNDARRGFETLGSFAMAVRAKELGQSEDEGVKKLMAAATTYATEGSGAEGGDLIPPEFSTRLWTKVDAEENLLTRCAQLQVGGNAITIPKDETAPWDTSHGIQVRWEAEAAAATATKPAFEPSTMRLNKLLGIVNVTDELLDDAPALNSWLMAKAPQKMAAKINTAIVRGTGVGQPLGILTSPSLISVAKETSQAADTVLFPNINKMWSRMYGPWRRNAVWIINQDIEPQLDAMAFDWQATGGKVPVYLPAGGASTAPYASLKGRPVVPVEACSTLGDQGDIMLVDFAQYWALTKTSGMRTDVSMHLYFDQGLQTFRFTFRLNGQPAWASTISPENGSTTRSWAVALDAR